MQIRRLVVAPIVAAAMLVPCTSAFAEPATGTPGEPQCYGQRVSFGSSQFGITPVDRAGFLGISVQDFHNRVKASCA
ncbi:MAG: hypothetical protein QOC66_1349 [Pseudonocardiales bacterium]|jgi:hypothetical protein|nr:hypothetical protein [Pseudonocardiales bacterium]